MIDQLSMSIARFFAGKKLIPKDELDSYAYGYQVILISIINWSSILIIAILTHSLIDTLFYMLPIVILRRHTGGYHASSYAQCYILSVSFYLIVLLLTRFIPASAVYAIAPVLSVITYISILKYAPIEHANNPQSKKRLLRHRISCVVFSSFFLILTIALLIAKLTALSCCAALGMFQVCILLLVEHINNLKKGGNHNEI